VTERDVNLHTARVCLTEARVRRALGQHRMADTLLQWASNARHRACLASVAPAPAQGDLFA
jgi:hypothetical protein